MVTVWEPHWKVLLTLLNMLMAFISWSNVEGVGRLPKPGACMAEHDAIPATFATLAQTSLE
jgi:hypothetical protein